MKKFNVGDKVKIIQRKKSNNSGTEPGWNKPNGNVGEIGYVTTITKDNYRICRTEDNKGYFGWFDEDDLELVSEEVSTTPYVEGKWYGCKDWRNKHDYVKLDYIYSDKTRIYFTECIDNKEYRQINDWWGIEKKELFEADMSIVSQFLPQGHPDKITAEEFVLPSKWCVKVDKNSQPEEVYKWRDIRWSDAGYICYDKHWNHRVYSTHTEITLEQFKQHVLKESPVVEIPKEIDMKAIQEEAKRRFPIGCKFYNTEKARPFTLLKDEHVYEICGTNIWAHNGCGCLYENGKWAELISLPEPVSINEFKEGDYIVTLDVEDGYNCARNNYCFKQRRNDTGIYPVVDLKGNKTNGHAVMSFDKKEFLKDWRYATPEEIAEYDRIGKPYDVTTLHNKKEESIPEYIECTSSKDSEPYFIKGNVYKVVKASAISSAELRCNILKDYKEHNILYTRLVDNDGTKLFKPSTKEAYEAQLLFKRLTKKDLVEGEIYIYDGSHISTYPEGPSFAIKEKFYEPNPNWLWTLSITHATEEQKALLRSEIEKRGEKMKKEEWSPGTYAVGVKGNFGVYKGSKNLIPIGHIYTIKENITDELVVEGECFWIYKENLKWFATREEAETFSKGLITGHITIESCEKSKPIVSQLWMSDPIVEERINTSSIKKETFIENVQSVNVMLRTKKKSIKF